MNKYIYLLAVVFGLSSCNDFLELSPTNKVIETDYYKGKPLCTRSPLRPGTDKKVDFVFSVQTKKREIVEEQHFLRISRFVSRLVF